MKWDDEGKKCEESQNGGITSEYQTFGNTNDTKEMTTDGDKHDKDIEKDGTKEQGYWHDYPYCVFCIFGNEFCERFSYYGMRAILIMYLNRALLYTDTQATVIYHTFVMLCYFTPILGALIADGWLGKYKTILYISILYAIGNATMAITAIPFGGSYNRAGPLVGLFIIALGTGGIKPCVSSFGGDQFKDHQERQKQSYFSIFYMCINIGSLMSMIITPILRSDVYCFGSNCYCLAFGVPAILMITAVIVFVVGTKWYTIIPPGENIIGNLIICIWTALKGKCFCNKVPEEEKKEHWLDYADVKFSESFIQDVKDVMAVIWIFLPLPFYWACYEQQGSTWTLQAGQMDGNVGNIVIQPDQVQVFNPLLIITLLPLMESVIYPCLTKIGIPHRPLQRMGWGMFLTAVSFIMAAGLQVVINQAMPAPIPDGRTQFKFVNAAPCNVTINTPYIPNGNLTLDYQMGTEYYQTDAGELSFEIGESTCPGFTVGQDSLLQEFMDQKEDYIVAVMIDNSTKSFILKAFHQNVTERTLRGESTTWIINALSQEISVNLMTTGKQENEPHEFNNITAYNVSQHDTLITADFYVYLTKEGYTTYPSPGEELGIVPSQNGAVTTLVIQEDMNGKTEVVQHIDVTQNSVNLLWQFPLYFVITLGECLFSVTGLSFAYMQAPPSMKSVVAACWLLTDSFGNLIVIIVELITQNMGQVTQFLVFAALMLIVLVVFIIMSFYYDYVEPRVELEDAEVDVEKMDLGKNGSDNGAFERDNTHF